MSEGDQPPESIGLARVEEQGLIAEDDFFDLLRGHLVEGDVCDVVVVPQELGDLGHDRSV
ncbi:MAG: hypothetical protein ACRDZR_12635 [Acidimicrobiales bacterium]